MYGNRYWQYKQVRKFICATKAFGFKTAIAKRLTEVKRGVAKFQSLIYLCAIIKHTIIKFSTPSSYILLDIYIHTDK